MDQVKIGKFIASLRKQAELTQEELGEKLGVTNKTVSRWENGNYMPDIEMLQLLAKEFHVNINEILAGERMSDAEFRKKADENIIAVSKSSAFSFEEKKAYFKKKWRKDHISLLVLLGVIFSLSILLPILFERVEFIGLGLNSHLCTFDNKLWRLSVVPSEQSIQLWLPAALSTTQLT